MSELPDVSKLVDLPPEIDTSQPHIARMYDYYLGGKNHFAADRELAEQGHRGHTRHADRAAGEPAVPRPHGAVPGCGSWHQAVPRHRHRAADHQQRARGRAAGRALVPVVYVDNDPLVLTHARALLTSSGEGRTAYIQGDLRNPREILSSPVVQSVLDFSQPVALLLLAVLQFIPDEDGPAEIVATLREALAPGSYLIASHVTSEHNVAGELPGSAPTRAAGCRCICATAPSSPISRSPGWSCCRRAWCWCRNGGRGPRRFRSPAKSTATAESPASPFSAGSRTASVAGARLARPSDSPVAAAIHQPADGSCRVGAGTGMAR